MRGLKPFAGAGARSVHLDHLELLAHEPVATLLAFLVTPPIGIVPPWFTASTPGNARSLPLDYGGTQEVPEW